MSFNTIYCGAFRFPEGDAAAARVYSIAKLLDQHGHHVSFAGWETTTDASAHYVFRNHDCYPMGEFREQPQNPLKRFMGFLFRGHRTLRWLSSNKPYQVVVAYNPPVFFSLGLFILRKMQGFQLILDSTEWYESEHLPGGSFGIAAVENWIRMKWVYPRFRNIICISQFLETHYRGKNTVNIPPLVAEEHPRPTSWMADSKRIRFLYAGNAGKKDLLTPFIHTLPRLADRLKRQVTLDIAGATWDEVSRQLQSEGVDPTTYADYVKCHGRLPKDSIPGLYEKADFSILFREEKRYAIAGFPTKAVESWSMGCPIILNAVGDIAEIATHMEDAVIVRMDQMEEDLALSLKTLLESDRLAAMRKSCLLKAQQRFTVSAYSQSFEKFLVKAGIDSNQQARGIH